MRVLFVAPWIPSPVRPRSLGVLRTLAESHDVWLVAAWDGREDLEHLDHLGLAGISIVRRHPVRGALRAMRALLAGSSLQVALLDEPDVASTISQLVRDWQPDVAHYNVIRSAGSLPAVGRIPVIFDFDEVRSDYYKTVGEHSSSLRWRVLGRLEHSRLARAEIDAAKTATVALMSSPADLDRLPVPTMLVRSPHDLHEEVKPDPARHRLLFVGRMSYQANREALDWFIKEVWPRLRSTFPGAVLDVVGESAETLPFAQTPGICLTGRVPTLDRYYAASSIAIVPVAIGTGVQMKLIQALSMGVPAITFSQCAVRAGAPSAAVATADTPEEWHHQIESLLTDTERFSAQRDAGLSWATDHYSNAAINRSVSHAYTRTFELVHDLRGEH
ncbi:glycosyltransferase [Nocardioides sp. BGMRC 2183]|nr:glycosyltransferase [Nocardioides sp. BGMRC 2183]